MKIIIISILALTIFGAVMWCSHSKYQLEEDEKLVNAISAQTAKKLHDEKGLILVGTGGEMMYEIKMLMMSFDYRKVVDVIMARKLLVDCVEEYLLEINSNEKIRPYLHNYPFTPKNIEIEIGFYNPDGSEVASGQINLASAREGKMFYYVDYPEKCTLKAIYEETYEDALKEVSSQ